MHLRLCASAVYKIPCFFRSNLGKAVALILLPASVHTFGQDTIPRMQSAPDSTNSRSWSLTGYVKDMQTVIFYKVSNPWITGNLIHNRLNFKWTISPSFRTAVEMRNRFFFGDMIQAFPGYVSAFEYDNGVERLSWNIFTGPSYVLNSSIDRIWLEYSKEKIQVTAGRQRVNWGINYVWNPNDIFNTYSYLDFDYEEKPGSDAVRIQYYPTSTSRAEITVKASQFTRITAAGLYRFNRWNYDFQFLGGVFDADNLVIGAGWAGQIAKGGFRGEMSYFYPTLHMKDTSGIFIASLGYDYTFRNSLQIQLEALYNGNPNGNLQTLVNLNEASPNALNAKNPFISDFSFFAGVTYPFLPLLTGTLSGIYNPQNQVYIVIPSLTLSVTDNIDLMLLAQVFQVYQKNAATSNVNFVFLRMKWSF
jgi:hypothetical protein